LLPATTVRTTPLFLLKGEGGPSGGVQIDRARSIDVKNGMHFRAIPGNANFGAVLNPAAAAGNDVIAEDLERLAEQGFEIDVLVEGVEVGIVIRDVPLPPGAYSIATTDLLPKTTTLHPQPETDMFWVDSDLVLASGAEPASSNLEMHFGRPWPRFNWHRNTPWVPGRPTQAIVAASSSASTGTTSTSRGGSFACGRRRAGGSARFRSTRRSCR
jgi:hypothetical protein